jgi:hypothetical protein
MASDKNIKRINVRMGQEIADWFENKASELGISTNAYMVMALNEYRKVQVSSDQMPEISAMLKHLGAMSKE